VSVVDRCPLRGSCASRSEPTSVSGRAELRDIHRPIRSVIKVFGSVLAPIILLLSRLQARGGFRVLGRHFCRTMQRKPMWPVELSIASP
jgi:hypothetical protein